MKYFSRVFLEQKVELLAETPLLTMITEERAFHILQLDETATAEEIVARYEVLKDEYRRIKDETEDLRTRLAYQLKQIELDDVFIYFRRKQII